jgi:hypothetical protein
MSLHVIITTMQRSYLGEIGNPIFEVSALFDLLVLAAIVNFDLQFFLAKHIVASLIICTYVIRLCCFIFGNILCKMIDSWSAETSNETIRSEYSS